MPIGFTIFHRLPIARGNVQKGPLSHPPSPCTPRRAFPRARPQYGLPRLVGRDRFWRAEATDEYVSTTNDRERRWQTFSTFPIPINEFCNSFRIKHHQGEWGFNVCPKTSWRKAKHGWPSAAGPNYLVARGANPKIRRPGKGPEHSWRKFLNPSLRYLYTTTARKSLSTQ